MNPKKIQQKKEVPIYLIFSNDRENVCPYCGQSFVTFKISVCICGMQVDNVQYVKTPKKVRKNYYSYKVGHLAFTGKGNDIEDHLSKVNLDPWYYIHENDIQNDSKEDLNEKKETGF